MKKFLVVLLVVLVILIALPVYASAENITPRAGGVSQTTIKGGLCVHLSDSYGPTFVDIENGSILVDGKTYKIDETPGVTAGVNLTMNFYAYMMPDLASAFIGTAIASSIEDDLAFLPHRVLIASVVSGPNPTDPALPWGGVIQSIKTFSPDCVKGKNLDVDGNGIIDGSDLIITYENHDMDVYNAIMRNIDIGEAISELTMLKAMVDLLINVVKLQIQLTKLTNPADTETIAALTAQLRALENKSEVISDILVKLNKKN